MFFLTCFVINLHLILNQVIMEQSVDFKPISFLKREKIQENIVVTPSFSLEIGMPIAPLVTTQYLKNSSEMFFRILVYVDNENSMDPILEVNHDQSKYRVVFNSANKIPSIYTLWYFEVKQNIVLNDSFEIVFYNYNLDPRTSRGTVTVVSLEVPELSDC